LGGTLEKTMIADFVKSWDANKASVRATFAHHPEDYKAIVRAVIEMLAANSSEYDKPDPERIHEINDGDYQGTLVYVIGASGYQPYRYWYVKVSYGSCSGCDTLEAIRGYQYGAPDESQVSQYMTLALHITQGLKEMGGSDA
jgi:hypothetical protein